MIAILTKYIPCTDRKPARIAATTCNGHRVVIPYSWDDEERMHHTAAQALVDRHFSDWAGDYDLHGGGTRDGFAWVLVRRNGDAART